MFFDEVTLELAAGRGGNGAMCFHREKYVDNGPPDGGNGGNGGSLILEADENFSTLQHFTGKKNFTAQNGENGQKNDMYGKNGEDLILKVPVGTTVFSVGADGKKGEKIVDLCLSGQKCLIAHGGRGGYGNGNFMSSTRQAPTFAELGDRGEELRVRLELSLVADSGLVGFPSSGKSTLISHVSSAKPKVAAYPFTTLEPHLGVVYLADFGGEKNQSFVIADIPGIIEGASEGKGLGHAFLKHISRTATLLILLDPFSYDGKSVCDQYRILRAELSKYSADLTAKDYFVVLNKIDSIPEEDRARIRAEFLKEFPEEKKRFWAVSGVSGEGLDKLMFDLFKIVKNRKGEKSGTVLDESGEDGFSARAEDIVEYKPYKFLDEEGFKVSLMYEVDLEKFEEPVCGLIIKPEVKQMRKLYKVEGPRIEQISRMTNIVYPDAINRVYDVMNKMGIARALARAGAVIGDVIKIGPHFFEFHEI
ncbi:MAG: GTPase ObgE [Candidatus Gracilibacteria bacterium]|jgi:GTP-binding protein